MAGKSNRTSSENVKNIDNPVIDKVVRSLIDKYGDNNRFRIERGVNQAAALWFVKDGTKEDFEEFCMKNFIANEDQLDKLFNRLSRNFEAINGYINKMVLDLREPVDLDMGEELPIDTKFAAYSPASHLSEDFFNNKIAFIILVNFPTYSLKEKQELGADWSQKQWAYARMGDMFTSRVPASITQKISEALTNSDSYIANYNIYAGYLVDKNGKTYFPKDKKLITHWNLRDELKSQYANKDGLFRQDMIYEVMKRIINQDIPEKVINSDKFTWNPFENKVFENGKEVQFKPENNVRYQKLLNNFLALKEEDAYSPEYPTYIKRKFEQEMEIPEKTVEKLFVDFVSSPVAGKIAQLIKKRLGRDLKPFDIWYDGFKARSSINEADLDAKTEKKYPNPAAFAKDMPNILMKLGFTKTEAEDISSKIQVDPARGAGHAWGAEMKSGKSHLRTRIGKDGMTYKGYNIAIHEFGHNVEQTLTLHNVHFYMMKGVPNTAFTEAWAFIFQKRDLELLGIKEQNENKKYLDALDTFWSTYEIMGVSLVDQRVWKWLYENPDATAAQLKEAVISIAKDVWNEYYAPNFGMKDAPILAIYSHMIDNPLYLSAYPIGYLIDFQIENYIAGKNLAEEMIRMCSQGRLIPQLWMKGAVGSEISIKPTIDAAEEALKHITE